MTRFPVLDGLRAISILAVLSAHMLPLGPKALRVNEAAGAMGMSLFFALSGFLITSNLVTGQTIRDFFVRRFTRILPLAYLYLAIVLLLLSYDPTRLLGNLFFIENYAHQYLSDLTGHFWSLCVEIHFYVAIGIAVAILGPRGIWVVLPACLAVTAMRISEGAVISIETHLRADEILTGSCVALFFHFGWLKWRSQAWWMIIAAGAWFASSSPLFGPLQYARPYASAALLAISLNLGPGFVVSILSSRPGRYVAEISYALYVVHPLTLVGWLNEGTVWERYLLKRPISFALTFMLAHLSTFYWENRWIAWGKKILRSRRTAPTISS